jgi:hypothetical protein
MTLMTWGGVWQTPCRCKPWRVRELCRRPESVAIHVATTPEATRRIDANPYSATTCGRNSVVECQLPKLDVRGSNPLARFDLRRSEAPESPSCVRVPCDRFRISLANSSARSSAAFS